ncbi:CHASE2 domain-containing protein [bacterium]|nr:CHASE2 domain-containing protein [bacterium]MBU4134275.1 CHASE2 domain-containing protein [bacterium]
MLLLVIFLNRAKAADIVGVGKPLLRLKPKDIVIVAISERSFKSVGEFPWKRVIYAKFLKKIKKYKPAITAFEPINILSNNALSCGHTGQLEANLVFEKCLPVIFSKNKIIPSFPLVVMHNWIRKISAEQSSALKYISAFDDFIFKNMNCDDSLDFGYSGKDFSFKTVEFCDILNNNFNEKTFENKIVLVGVTAPLLKYPPILNWRCCI